MKRLHPQRFSLVELMVVIAVLTILAGLTLVAVSRVRASGRQSVCIGQLRQIGAALTLYANDNEDRLPVVARLGPAPSFHLQSLPQALDPYVGDPLLFRCPGDQGEDSLYGTEGTSYEWNTFASGRQIDRTTLKILDLRIHAPLTGDGEDFHRGKGRNFLWPDGHVSTSLEILIE